MKHILKFIFTLLVTVIGILMYLSLWLLYPVWNLFWNFNVGFKDPQKYTDFTEGSGMTIWEYLKFKWKYYSNYMGDKEIFGLIYINYFGKLFLSKMKSNIQLI